MVKKILYIAFILLVYNSTIHAQVKIETPTNEKLLGDEKIILSTINYLGSRKYTTIDSILQLSGYNRTKKTAFVGNQDFAPYSGYFGESLTDGGSFWNLMSGYNNKIIKLAPGYAAFSDYIGGRNNTITDAYSSFIFAENSNITSGYLSAVLSSQNSSITNSGQSVMVGSENSNISSLANSNMILNSMNSNINSRATGNSSYVSILSSTNSSAIGTNCSIIGSTASIVDSTNNSIIFSASNCTIKKSGGYSLMTGNNNYLDTDGAYVSISGSTNIGKSKSVLTSILNGYNLKIDNAHNTIINGQNSEIIGDAASFHGFNTMLNGEANLLDKVSYNTTSGMGLIGYTAYQLSLGKYNVDKRSSTLDKVLWNDADDIISIGNGTTNASRSNVFTLKKNGKLQVNTIIGGKTINDVEPEVTAEFIGKDAIAIPAGTTSERPAAPSNNSTTKSYVRYNTTSGKFEGYDLNTATWVDLN